MYIKNLQNKFLSILRDRGLRSTIYVTCAYLIAAVINYCLQLFLARKLSVSEFGEFTALLSLGLLFAIPSSGLATALVKLSSELKALGKLSLGAKIYKNFVIFFSGFGLLTILVMAFFKNTLAASLNIATPELFLYFGVYLLFIFLSLLPPSFLQGYLKFLPFSFHTIVSALFRLGFPVVLLLAGFGLRGVLAGLSISFFLAFILGHFLLHKDLSVPKTSDPVPYKKVFFLGLASTASFFGMTIMNNIDVMFVKGVLNSDSAGLYSALVTVGKVYLFGAGTVATVMFPQISAEHAKGGLVKEKTTFFFKMQLLAVFFGVVLFYFFPNSIISTLFGAKFMSVSGLLPGFSLFVAFYILIQFFILLLIALGHVKVWLPQLIAILLQIAGLYFFGKSLETVVLVNSVVSALLLIMLLLYYKTCVSVSGDARL